jgi:hypothetical protein
MARMVRSNNYLDGLYELPAVPAVAPQLLTRYQDTLPGRLKTFPKNDIELLEVPEEDESSSKFQHLLRYDAESMFWLLLWWCIQAQPEGDLSESIPILYWAVLVEVDFRGPNFIGRFPKNCLHSSYSGLRALLNDMGRHIQGDLKFSKIKEKKEPEYIHEVFQRLILNFLVTNESESFMDLEKADIPRPVENMVMKRTRTYSTYTKSSQSTTSGEPEESTEESMVSVHHHRSNISIYACPPVAKEETACAIAI